MVSAVTQNPASAVPSACRHATGLFSSDGASCTCSPGQQSSAGQHQSGHDQSGSTQRRQSGDRLSGEPVDLACVREAQPHAQPAPRRQCGIRLRAQKVLPSNRASVRVPRSLRLTAGALVNREYDRGARRARHSNADGAPPGDLAFCATPEGVHPVHQRPRMVGPRRGGAIEAGSTGGGLSLGAEVSVGLHRRGDRPCWSPRDRQSRRHPAPITTSGIADQNPTTLCQLKSRARPRRRPLKVVTLRSSRRVQARGHQSHRPLETMKRNARLHAPVIARPSGRRSPVNASVRCQSVTARKKVA